MASYDWYMTHMSISDNWETFSERALKCATSPLELEQGREALNFFREHFGEKFISGAIDNGHPFYHLFVYNPSFQLKWIQHWYQIISTFRNNQKFSTLLRELKDPKRFFERVFVLEIAFSFSKYDFDIIFDREFVKDGRRPRPDITLTDIQSGTEIVLELKGITDGEKVADADTCWEWFEAQCNQYFGFYIVTGALYKTATPEEKELIKGEIIRAGNEYSKRSGLVTIEIPGLIEVALRREPSEREDELYIWCQKRGFDPNSAYGPPYMVSEQHRVCGSIREKEQQLPTNRYGIIVLFSGPMSSMQRDVKSTKALINAVKSTLKAYPHIGMVSVNALFVQDEWRGIKKYEDHWAINRPFYVMHILNTLLIKNSVCKQNLPDALIERIQAALSE